MVSDIWTLRLKLVIKSADNAEQTSLAYLTRRLGIMVRLCVG